MNTKTLGAMALATVSLIAFAGTTDANAYSRSGWKSCGSRYLHVQGTSQSGAYLYGSVPGGYKMGQYNIWVYGTDHGGSWKVWHNTLEYPQGRPFCDMI